MRYKSEIFEGTHEPILTKKLFDKCQAVLQKRGKVQGVRKHNFAFLGLMKCASCGLPATVVVFEIMVTPFNRASGSNCESGSVWAKHWLAKKILIKTAATAALVGIESSGTECGSRLSVRD